MASSNEEVYRSSPEYRHFSARILSQRKKYLCLLSLPPFSLLVKPFSGAPGAHHREKIICDLKNMLNFENSRSEMIVSSTTVSSNYPAPRSSSLVMSAPPGSPTLSNTPDCSPRVSSPSSSSFDQGSWCSLSRESCLLDQALLSPAASGYNTDDYNEYMLISEPSRESNSSAYVRDLQLDHFPRNLSTFIMPSPSTSNHLHGHGKSVCVLRSELNNLSRLVDMSQSIFRAYGVACDVEVVLLSDQTEFVDVRFDNAPTLCLINDGDVRWTNYISRIQRSYNMSQESELVIINAVSTNFFLNISTLTSACRPSRVWSSPDSGDNKLRSQIADYASDMLIPGNRRDLVGLIPAESEVSRLTAAVVKHQIRNSQYRHIENDICMELSYSEFTSDPLNVSPYIEAFCRIRKRIMFPFSRRSNHINLSSRRIRSQSGPQRRTIFFWAGLTFFLGLEIGFAFSSSVSFFALFCSRNTKEDILATAPTFRAWRSFQRFASCILDSMDLK